MIQKIKFSVEIDYNEDVEEWIRFQRADLLGECVKHLSLVRYFLFINSQAAEISRFK